MAGLAISKSTAACMLMMGCGVKVDLQLESGEYFLAQEARAERTKETQQQRQAERVAERKRKREAAFEPPAQVSMLCLELGDVHALIRVVWQSPLMPTLCSRKQLIGPLTSFGKPHQGWAVLCHICPWLPLPWSCQTHGCALAGFFA